jgi:hypothetical protein
MPDDDLRSYWQLSDPETRHYVTTVSAQMDEKSQ